MKYIISSAIFALFCTSTYAQVKSVSGENFVQYGPEEAYWVFQAICDDDSERKIQRKTDGSEWCGKDLDSFCDTDKDKAADLICGPRYSEGLALQRETLRAEDAQKRAQQERERQEEQDLVSRRRAEEERARLARAQAAAASESQRIAIEEELLTIDREKLKLRREEIELQRRVNEIEVILGLELKETE